MTKHAVEVLQKDSVRYDPDHALLLMQLYRLQSSNPLLEARQVPAERARGEQWTFKTDPGLCNMQYAIYLEGHHPNKGYSYFMAIWAPCWIILRWFLSISNAEEYSRNMEFVLEILKVFCFVLMIWILNDLLLFRFVEKHEYCFCYQLQLDIMMIQLKYLYTYKNVTLKKNMKSHIFCKL